MSQIKPLKIKSFLPYNFAIITTCVAIRLADRMEQEWVVYSFDYPVVIYMFKVFSI